MSKNRLAIIFVMMFLILGTVPCALGATTGVSQYWTWTYGTYSSVGSNYIAPTGYSYAVADVHIHNTGTKKISTNPFYWYFIADGITYSPDTPTFDSSIYRSSVDVGQGGDITTTFVYLVKGAPQTAILSYDDPY